MGIDYTASVITAANNAGVPPALALSVMQQESGGNASAVSSAGAVGLFQLMPSSFPGQNIQDPTTNIDLGVGYLGQLLNQYNGDVSLALAAYDAGPGNVAKYGGVPPFSETQNYVASILSSLGLSSGANVSSLSDSGSSDTSTNDSGTLLVDDSGNIDPTSAIILGAVGVGIVGLIYVLS